MKRAIVAALLASLPVQSIAQTVVTDGDRIGRMSGIDASESQ
jgi:hypothetical protein